MRLVINIDVPALEPAVKFYSSALGLKLKRMLDNDVAELIGGSVTIYLLQKSSGSAPSRSVDPERKYSRHWTPVHIDFVVEDISKAATRAINAGALKESECIEWLGSKCITFSDPFGHGFCLIEFEQETYIENLPDKRR